MRKHRGWVGNNEILPVQAVKPTSLSFQLNGTVVCARWAGAIGCVEGYKIYGGKAAGTLSVIGETNANSYTFQLNQADYPYFIAVSTFYGNVESEFTPIVAVRREINVPVQKPVVQPDPEIVPESAARIAEPQTENYPFGLCSCCLMPQPLMKRKEKVVCSRNPKQIYSKNGRDWVIQPQQIVSDIEQMDELLRQNTAYVGIGGVLITPLKGPL
jgi:hypothetical protein